MFDAQYLFQNLAGTNGYKKENQFESGFMLSRNIKNLIILHKTFVFFKIMSYWFSLSKKSEKQLKREHRVVCGEVSIKIVLVSQNIVLFYDFCWCP